MLKRISVQQLTLGMYLKDFCGSWMEHPFWRSAFVITDPKDLASIRASSITEVWIDCAKGLDLAPDDSPVAVAESVAEVDIELASTASKKRETASVSSGVEFARAARIVTRSREAITAMFGEARMGKAIDSVGAQRLVDEISDSMSRNPGALVSIARLKSADNYTYMHSVAVCGLMVTLARQLGLDPQQTQSAGLAGLLHDLGKALIPTAILNKPGRLTDAEFTLVKSHPEKGHQILLEGHGADAIALDVVLHHHEKTDGSGYPKRLKGDDISLFAKMGAVCDVYDAITSDRPYKAGWCPAESLRRMNEWTKGHFEPRVFQAFVKTIGIYPIGTLVRLSCGRLGVVTEQGSHSLLRPQVKVFFSTRSNERILPTVIDLAHADAAYKIVNIEDPEKWKFSNLSAIWSGLPNLPG
ncbi:MAG: Cyclic di-GMP phosphodiesterase response regulator RpfG [Candidatus Accumulibacter phosphatis]|uniref:Cyclic di-GMP phosphodiesterase response regulator RpfG n=1 Tax=Candidatus Accumulibacter phosphatis TaxID=327160 RepID=A0A084Y6J8_9PROT|nr:HD-GYP domain-containing protein [Accumulibacter sp.]KFB70342.1 MAG: Cyclic di-GMP phosphodiesterase response regulator RpfG [Candidatus Accumulibacter phosphatis]HCZ13134.1 HD-GYP domain-containing protein [Accumulibacter sp.]HRF12082.1 HD-GYP domain-containing protein [Candidatus Accumulibacter phosphatis]